jgi:ribonuclease HI
MLQQTEIIWSPAPPFRFSFTHYKLSFSPHLFIRQDDSVIMFQICRLPRSHFKATYQNVPHICHLVFSEQEFIPVDTYSTVQGFLIVGDLPTILSMTPCPLATNSLEAAVNRLDPSLKRLCGTVYTTDIEHPLLYIARSGPVDGLPQKLSSSRGELAGLTAITIIAHLLRGFYSSNTPVWMVCDNQSVLNKCNSLPLNWFWRHCDKNFDLFLTQQNIAKTMPISYNWVKGHTEKAPWNSISDLAKQNLSKQQIYNIWCDKMVDQEWVHGQPSLPDPGISPEERWAIYLNNPHLHKLTGDLTTDIPSALGYTSAAQYLMEKHNVNPAKLQQLNTTALGHFISQLKPLQRACHVKLIHGWIPTFSALCCQGRHATPICPRCQQTVETPDHVYQCQ